MNLALLLVLPALADPVPGLSPEATAGVPSPALDATTAVQLWSRTGVEGVPTLGGDPALRFAERLGLDVRNEQGWHGSLRGGLRRTGDARLVGDLWRGSLSYTRQDRAVQLGRHVRMDARGFQRLDGISGHMADGGAWAWRAWLGRRWHPEVSAAKSAWVGGTEAQLTPVDSASAPEVRVGLEGRQTPTGFALRSWGRVQVQSVYGRRGSLLVEGDDKARMRASLEGTLPAGRHLDLGGELRWEDLVPSTALDQPRAPLLWLAPDGYGIGTVRLRWSRDGWGVAASGGPSLRRPGSEWIGGGLGRAVVSRRFGASEVAVHGLAAGIGRARLAGGGAAMGLDLTEASLRLQGAVWHLRPLDQAPAWIAEVRALGQADLVRLGRDDDFVIGLAGQGSTGADRQLRPFLRGGLALTGRWARREAR